MRGARRGSIIIRVERRFVIQLHTIAGGRHYDLMLEAGAALATWRLERLPEALGDGESLPAEALPDHRPAYLTYEGPISSGRGTVQIADAGAFRSIDRDENRWSFELQGRLVRGRFSLRRLEGDRWLLSAGPS